MNLMRSFNRTIAIMGGMGPESGVGFHSLLLKYTRDFKPVNGDSDHLDVVHYSLSSTIPARISFLLGLSSDNPALTIFKHLKSLNQFGEFHQTIFDVIIVCNTFHVPLIFNHLKELIHSFPLENINLLNFAEEVVDALAEQAKILEIKKVAIFSTEGEWKYGLYKNLLENKGITGIQVSSSLQKTLNLIIHRLKGGEELEHKLYGEIHSFYEQLMGEGAQGLLLGCTELSKISRDLRIQQPLFDSLHLVAERLVKKQLQK